MSGGRRAIWRRSSVGVSPVRLATEMFGHGFAEAFGGEGDAGQRGAQVALDVVGQRLERRDVEDADRAGSLAGGRRARVRGEAIEGPEEGGQGLATPRRGVDQRVLATGDGLPAAGLGVGGRLEARLEPVTDGWREGRERIGDRGDCGHRAAQCTAVWPFRPDVHNRWRRPRLALMLDLRRSRSLRQLMPMDGITSPRAGTSRAPTPRYAVHWHTEWRWRRSPKSSISQADLRRMTRAERPIERAGWPFLGGVRWS